MPREIQVSNLRRGCFRNGAQERQAGGAQGIAGNVRLGNQQAGARILLQVLGVHRHAADEKGWTAKLIGRIGHHGAEGESGKLTRMRRQATDPAE